MIDIVISINNRFAQHAGVMLASLFENNKHLEFTIHVFHKNLSLFNIENLKSIIDYYSYNVLFYDVSSYLLLIDKLPSDNRITEESYFRLLIPDILNKSIHKVLYLDSDVVINGDISELWNINIDNYSSAVVLDEISPDNNILYKIECQDKEYFNAGVMLLNLDYIRHLDFMSIVDVIVKKYIGFIKYHDQDILNVAFATNKYILSNKWNYTHGKDSCLVKKCIREPVIIHFIGPIKPWHWHCKHKYACLYMKYLKLTPWRNYKSTFLLSAKDLKFIHYIAYLLKVENMYFFIGRMVKYVLRK